METDSAMDRKLISTKKAPLQCIAMAFFWAWDGIDGWMVLTINPWLSPTDSPINAIWDLQCTDLTADFPRFFQTFQTIPMDECHAPIRNQSLTDCGQALGDIWKI